ncbi:Uncharacterised protein [Rhodococcus gordoniae]|uniref:Uncharacterized protein n=1 Tax=Rhodococcus gordoniae TaxID=223392 RepID=A0A379M4F5_9NOCA|nr:Uncharacterised protein [Rhodococcus gordoniae]
MKFCNAPCHSGGIAATRKYSKAKLGRMWHCNRRVRNEGE